MLAVPDITGMTRTHELTKNRKTLILGFFDLMLPPGVLMKGCALVRHSNGQVTCWPPKFGNDKRRAVVFISGDLKREITDKAVSAFYALGGTDDELQPGVGC